jgi:WD40 repeat protein
VTLELTVSSRNNISRHTQLTMVILSPRRNKTGTDKFPAHPTDIFSLSTTNTQILSASGSSSIRIHSTTDPDFPLAQTLEKVHKLGCHHLATSRDGQVTASAGFAGEVRIWALQDGSWSESHKIVGANFLASRLCATKALSRLCFDRWQQSRRNMGHSSFWKWSIPCGYIV